MPNLVETQSYQASSEQSRSITINLSAPNLLSYDINFSTSGQMIVPNSGDALPLMNKLIGCGMNFPGVGTAVTCNTWWSGGVSGTGGISDTLTFNSGYAGLSWYASGQLANPFRSGGASPITLYGIAFVNTYLASGQLSSGTVRLLYNN